MITTTDTDTDTDTNMIDNDVSNVSDSSTEDRLSMLKQISAAANPWLDSSKIEHASAVIESLRRVVDGQRILIVGEQASGKSTLLNALIGQPMFPSYQSQTSPETDTLNVIEFYNDPYLQYGVYKVEIMLKSKEQWKSNFDFFLSNQVDHLTFKRKRLRDGSEKIGTYANINMLRALHPECYADSDRGEQLRRQVEEYVTAMKQQADEVTAPAATELTAPELILDNTLAINDALQHQMRQLTLSSCEEVNNVLDMFCRSHVHPGTHEHHKRLLQIGQQDKYRQVADLLQLPDRWPLVQLVTISANVTKNGIIPPFCRLFDTSGLGGDSSLMGQDIIASIENSVQGRSIDQIWYVNEAGRSVTKHLSLNDIRQLRMSFKKSDSQFVYTQADKLPEDRIEDAIDNISNNLSRALGSQNNPIFFVTSHGYAAAINQPELFNLSAQKQTDLAERYTSAKSSNIPALVAAVEDKTWKDIRALHRDMQIFVRETYKACMTTVDDQSSHQFSMPDAKEVSQSDPESPLSTTWLEIYEAVDTFIQSCTSVFTVPQHRNQFSQETKDKLQQLTGNKVMTLRAVFTHSGQWKGTDIGKDMHMFQLDHDDNATVTLFTKLFDHLDSSCQMLMRQYGEAVMSNSQYPFIHDLYLNNALVSMDQQIKDIRRMYSIQQSPGQQLLSDEQYQTVWTEGYNKWLSAARSKMQAAIDFSCQQLDKNDYYTDALKRWCETLQRHITSTIEQELQRLHDKLDHTSLATLTERMETLDCLCRDAKAYLFEEQIQSGVQVVKTWRDGSNSSSQGADRTVSQPLAERNSIDDHRWIVGTKDGNKVCLLFRGLCAIDEAETVEKSSNLKFPVPALLFPHQTLLRAVVSDFFKNVLVEEPLTTKAQADAIAMASAAAIVETVMDSVMSDSTRHKWTTKQIAAHCNELTIAPYLQAEKLLETSRVIRESMLQFDKPSSLLPSEQEQWKNFDNKRQPPLARQNQYTNTTDKFMNGYVHYQQVLGKNPTESIEQNRGIATFPGAAVANWRSAWFYWRWLSPKKFHLPAVLDSQLTHVNPFNSSSQRPEHAIRYGVGLKTYIAGQQYAGLQPVMYNKDGSCQTTNGILGVVVVTAITQEYIINHSEHVRIILQLSQAKQIKLPGGDRRIGAEAEVTLYGGMPAEAAEVVLSVPIIAPDLRPTNRNAPLMRWYGTNRYDQFVAAAKKIATAKPNSQQLFKAQRDFRKMLDSAVADKIHASLTAMGYKMPPIDHAVIQRDNKY